MIPAPTSLSSEKTLALLSIQFRPKINSALPQRPTGRKSPGRGARDGRTLIPRFGPAGFILRRHNPYASRRHLAPPASSSSGIHPFLRDAPLPRTRKIQT